MPQGQIVKNSYQVEHVRSLITDYAVNQTVRVNREPGDGHETQAALPTAVQFLERAEVQLQARQKGRLVQHRIWKWQSSFFTHLRDFLGSLALLQSPEKDLGQFFSATSRISDLNSCMSLAWDSRSS